MTLSKISIAIAGGGVGGLSLAAGLIQHPQLDIHIYESTPHYRDRGGGLALHGNAITAMDLIDPQLKKTYFSRAIFLADDEEIEIATQVILAAGPESGRVVGRLGAAKGRRTISRTDLMEGWRALIPAERIHFRKKLVDIIHEQEQEHQVQLQFEDGTTAVADCLIGADGIHSLTRKYLLGVDHPAVSPKNVGGSYVYTRLVPIDEAQQVVRDEWTRNVPIFCGPAGAVVSLPIHRGQTLSCGVTIYRKAGSDDENDTGKPVPFDKEAFSEYIDDARNIVEVGVHSSNRMKGQKRQKTDFLKLVSRNPGPSQPTQDHDPAPYYYKNHVAMIGDAAHATLAAAGNGAAQAIEDAAVLHALFAQVTDVSQIAKAFAAFDAVRRPRSQKVVEISRNFSQLYSFRLDEVVGTDPDKMTAYIREMGSYTNDYDLEAQNRNAVGLYEELLK
jgi:salicylate hydroxylase